MDATRAITRPYFVSERTYTFFSTLPLIKVARNIFLFVTIYPLPAIPLWRDKPQSINPPSPKRTIKKYPGKRHAEYRQHHPFVEVGRCLEPISCVYKRFPDERHAFEIKYGDA